MTKTQQVDDQTTVIESNHVTTLKKFHYQSDSGSRFFFVIANMIRVQTQVQTKKVIYRLEYICRYLELQIKKNTNHVHLKKLNKKQLSKNGHCEIGYGHRTGITFFYASEKLKHNFNRQLFVSKVFYSTKLLFILVVDVFALVIVYELSLADIGYVTLRRT